MGKKQCRICLEPDNDDLISVQLVQDQVTISDMIFAVAGVSVTSDRRLPQNICLVCLERLKVAHDLRRQCIEADANLRAALPSPCEDYLIEQLDEDSKYTTQKTDEGILPEKDESFEILEIAEQRLDDETCKHDDEPTDDEIGTPEHNEDMEQYTESVRFDSPVPWQEHVHYLAVDADCFACCGCSLSFGSKHELKVHSVRIHRKSKYRSKFHPLQCTVCYQTFLCKASMEAHQTAGTRHQTRSMLQCLSCNALLADKKSIFDHLEEHHSHWNSVSENDQKLEDHDQDEEEMLDELESVISDAPRFTAVEGIRIEIQGVCKDGEDHDSKHFSHESAASEEEEMGEEEYVIEVNFDGESAMEEDAIDNSLEKELVDDCEQAPPNKDEDEDPNGTTSKGQRIRMNKLMCRIPSNVVRVVTEEECYSIVELVQQRCCCCTAFFKSPEKLEKHLAKKRQAMADTSAEASVKTYPKYTCEYCGMQFKYAVLYVVHKRVREQRQFYMCRLCRRLVDSEARMKSHMLHTEEHALFFKLLREDITDRYESLTLPGERCCICWQYFDSHDDMLEHVHKTHALEAGESSEQKSNLPYACEFCKRRFSRQQYLERHLEQATNGLQHFCKLCDFQTRSRKRMELHLYSAIHRSEMPSVALLPLEPHAKLEPLRYCCFVNCKLHFRDVEALYQHVREAHERKLQLNKKHAQSMIGGSERGYLECDACGQQFKGITALKIHQSQSVQQNCVCSICGAKKRSRGALLEHERTHTGERPYGCDLCDKKFGSSTTLNSHMKCHTPRKYECGTCKVMFARLENLKRHIRLRHGEASYQCELCPKMFKTRENLTAHMRTHTGEKPYKCRTESCDKRYVNIGDRRRHEMAVHTLERPHKCSYCHMAFVRPRQLVIHERRHTGNKPFVCTLCGKGFYERAHLTKHPCKAAA